jgi:cytochrome c-type biogenesis protein CcmH
LGDLKKLKWCCVLFFIFFSGKGALAMSPEEYLQREQEQRARELFLQVKCPICAGQVIESSDTQVAYQLRKLIRSKISEGQSNKEIKNYLVKKYGDDILNVPIANTRGFILYFLPILFLIFGIIYLKISVGRAKHCKT